MATKAVEAKAEELLVEYLEGAQVNEGTRKALRDVIVFVVEQEGLAE